MNWSEIHTSIRHKLDEMETGVDDTHWSPERLLVFANEGLRDVAIRLPARSITKLQKTLSLNLSYNIQSYPLPTDFFRIVDILVKYGNATSIHIPITIIEHKDLSALANNIFYAPSTKNPFAILWEGNVDIYPIPQATYQNGMYQIYLVPPTAMTGDSSIPEVPIWSHDWIVLYAVAQALHEEGTNEALADKVMAEYLSKFGGTQLQQT